MGFLHILDLLNFEFPTFVMILKGWAEANLLAFSAISQLSRLDDQRCILPWASLIQEFIFAEVARLGPMH